ncbi:MAG TPA: ABC transporter permease [Mucilaginibacter sp.]
MLKNYIKIAWRNIIRHKSYSAINIAGLAVGVAACLLIFVVVQYELSFDKFQPNYKNIYRVVMKQTSENGINYMEGVPYPMPDALRIDFPQAKFARLITDYGALITANSNTQNAGAGTNKFIEPIGVLFIEPQFFEIFKHKWLSGDKSALAQPNMLVLSKSSADKYFGDWKHAVGKLLKIDNLISARVAGIIEDAPSNSDFQLKVMISFPTLKPYLKAYNFEDNWDNVGSNSQVFMMLPPQTTPGTIEAQFKGFVTKHYNPNNIYSRVHFLQPLSNMHFDTRFSNALGDHLTNMATIRTLMLIALLIIVMASINFINLSTAQSVGRSKEVGIRKVLGSSRAQLINQSLGETGLIVIVSVILAIVIAWLSLPFLKNIASVPDDISLISIGSVLFLIAVVLFIVLLSGIYPALIVSGFKPVLAIKNKITAASIGGIPLRRVLVIGQFAIAQLLIIGTIVAVQQMNFVNKADLGFNKDAVLVMPGNSDSVSISKMYGFKQQLLQNPAVKSVSFASDQPSSNNNWAANFYFNNSTKDLGYETFYKMADADYFKTYGLRFVAGHGYEQSDTLSQAVVNETFLKKLGIQNPNNGIGKTVRLGAKGKWASIVGVVADFKTNSLRDAVKPIMIFPRKKFESVVAVKLSTTNLAESATQLQKLWETTYPDYAYTGYFLDDNIAQFYKQENQLALVYKIFALIAIFISCLGLYGLVSFMVVQRTKEVGVRKVLGASVGSIVYLFSKEFMILIACSFAIAMPAAWYMMTGWLQNFVYRINLTPGVFVVAVFASLIIAWLTVGYKAIKAALANPVKSLRSE